MSQPELVEINGYRFYKAVDDLYPVYLNEGNAAAHIVHVADKWCRGKGIDIGGGKWPFPGAFDCIDQKTGGDAYDLSRFEDGSLDFIFSSHCLEHLSNPQEALMVWARKLRPGGIVFLYLPHPAMKLWRPGEAWVGDGHKWAPELQSVITMLWNAGAPNVGCSEWPDAYWSFYVVGRKR